MCIYIFPLAFFSISFQGIYQTVEKWRVAVCVMGVCMIMILFESVLSLFDSTFPFHNWWKLTANKKNPSTQMHHFKSVSISAKQQSNWAITFTFPQLPLTLMNLQSQRKLKSLKNSTAIIAAFEGE